MDASDFFAQPGYKPLLVQNQYGGSVGAPVKKDRAWLFGAYEGTHTRSESVGVRAPLPTAAYAQGNFGSTAIYRSAVQCGKSERLGLDSRSQFPGNIIPASRFDKIGQQVLKLLSAAQPARAANNLRGNVPQLQSITTWWCAATSR